MSFGGLILTNIGRNKMAAAISENTPLKFTHIQLGDGYYNGSFSSKTKLSHMIMEIPVTRIQRNDDEVLIECDWNSTQAPVGFYLREIGIIGNGGLCYYDNTREGDSEFIDPESEAIIKQKRFRFTLVVSSDVAVTVKISSELYAMAEEVDSLKKSVSDGKKSVADAITAMGVSTSSTEDSPATFEVLTDHIRAITPTLTLKENTATAKVGSNEVTQQIGYSMGGDVVPGTSNMLLFPAGSRIYALSDYVMKSLGGNAEAAHVLAGKTFSSNVSGREKAGTMANQGAKTATLTCGGSYIIPAGYHNGAGKVTANSLASQTVVDSGKSAAGAAQILTGYQAYVNGSKVSGTMANKGAVMQSLNCGGSYTIPAGYHNGSGKVTANSLASQITTTAVYDKYKYTEKVLATCPVDLTSANCHYNGNDAIYLIGGNNGRQTTRYNIKDNTYTTLGAAPQNILYNSSVMLGNQIICFGDSNVLTFMVASGGWHTGVTIPASSRGGSVALVDDTMIFGSKNSDYSKYVTKYSHSTNFSGGSFSTICTNQTVCSNNDTCVRYCNPGVSDGVDVFVQNVKLLYRPNYTSYLSKKTLPGIIYGGAVAIPNRGYFLCAVQYSNQNILWDGISDTMTTLNSSQHYFYTAALCAVGDDVYIFGSGKIDHNRKASVFHTEQFFKTHY